MSGAFRRRALLRALLLGGGAVTLLPAGARAQDARLRQRLDPATYAEVSAQLDSARQAGLPLEPLTQKALEGQSKGAAGASIAGSVRRLRADLAASRRALGASASQSDLLAASTLLGLGIDTLALRRMAAARPALAHPTLAGAIMGVAFLVQRGVSAGAALDVASAMLSAGLTEPDFRALQRLVAGDIRQGAAPAEAARTRARGLIRQARELRAPESPRP